MATCMTPTLAEILRRTDGSLGLPSGHQAQCGPWGIVQFLKAQRGIPRGSMPKASVFILLKGQRVWRGWPRVSPGASRRSSPRPRGNYHGLPLATS